jgi:hypothetical protein
MSERTQKLVSIRHHTDLDLQVLVSRELERAFALLDVAATSTSPLFAQAVRAYDTATVIVPRISGVSDGERLQIESRLKELRVRLDQMAAACVKLERYPVSVAS